MLARELQKMPKRDRSFYHAIAISCSNIAIRIERTNTVIRRYIVDSKQLH